MPKLLIQTTIDIPEGREGAKIQAALIGPTEVYEAAIREAAHLTNVEIEMRVVRAKVAKEVAVPLTDAKQIIDDVAHEVTEAAGSSAVEQLKTRSRHAAE